MGIHQPRPAEIVTALKDYGVPTVERSGWRTRGTQYDASFYGHLNHHDALMESVSDQRALQLMEQGRSDLPGPLCNGWGDSDGTYYLVAYGNANHAGRGEQDVLERVKAGEPPTGDARLDPDGDGPVGNTWFWGTEWRNAGDGRDPYEQLDTMVRANAALVDVFNWPNANVCIGHKEWTKRKPDPAGFDMFEFRRLVANRLAGPSGAAIPKELDMFTLQQINQPWPPPPAPPDERVWCVADNRQSCWQVPDLETLAALQDDLRRMGRPVDIIRVSGRGHKLLTITPGWKPQ